VQIGHRAQYGQYVEDGALEVRIANEKPLLPSGVGDHTGGFLEGGAATYTAAEFKAHEMTYEAIKEEEDDDDEEAESPLEKGEVGLGDEDEYDGERDSLKGKGEVRRAYAEERQGGASSSSPVVCAVIQ